MIRERLHDHAVLLHRQGKDDPLPAGGEPYPDDPRPRTAIGRDARRVGADVAAILDAHFASPAAAPRALVGAFDEVYVPVHDNEHVAAAALRAGRKRVRRTGRWLVRHGVDRREVAVGLALLGTEATASDKDIELIRTIGLLSAEFGALAAESLRHRGDAGVEALLWLAERTRGWGRVPVIEALCEVAVLPEVRAWLLRHACAGDDLDAVTAGAVATAAHLHAAIIADDADDELVDHTAALLRAMADGTGQGLTLADYPPARYVLAAHARHLARQKPTWARYAAAAVIADRIARLEPEQLGCTKKQRERLVERYEKVLRLRRWQATVPRRKTKPKRKRVTRRTSRRSAR
ncbi:hypothetical protein Daura_38790 [Dactylosporangium aurantiacum]|uniref:Uncharacterized protein n=1 Tax=Dactylosporangium aurantiacum TaxID=35754 RepID=A0A9Q9IHA4_9ACTN|nr:hypothetical protein [Dactylosporangium aurantiacum]MDG6101630.1 hypothetical protein [Dactylosporangium aurantiacum]UWZ52545.1 hypothetical protein Daura_38790 [Dactylosporangium aurantiacum]